MSLVLLAEDDRRLAELVKDYLENNDFRVVIEENGNRVSRAIQDLSPDLVMLDINLPGKDGLTICKEAREFYPGPILMLTARDSDMDQVLGLEFGADDYVIKPAEPRVLLARVRALLRRTQALENQEERDISIGKLSICTTSRTVAFDGQEIALSSHEFDLLITFAKQVGKVLSREYLFNTIYGRPYDGLDRTIDVRISQLRKKLGDNSETPSRIKTIWGRGYLFVADAWE